MSPTPKQQKTRCTWPGTDPLYLAYHDQEWGLPETNSRALWELLMLEGFQAGLSWITVLRKREAFRAAFKQFDPEKVARFKEADIERLMQNPGIIRARAKIEATIQGARIFVDMQQAGTNFAEFAWTLAGGKPIQNTGPCRPSRRSPKPSQRNSSSADSNSSAPPSSTPGCRRQAWSTITHQTASAAKFVRRRKPGRFS